MTTHRLDAVARGRLVDRIAELIGVRADVRLAVIYGSVLEPDAPFRDVDVGIWTESGSAVGDDLELAVSLSAELRLPVDVRRLNDAPIPFVFHALRGRVVVVRDDGWLADLMERTARVYHDREPLLRRATAEAFAR